MRRREKGYQGSLSTALRNPFSGTFPIPIEERLDVGERRLRLPTHRWVELDAALCCRFGLGHDVGWCHGSVFRHAEDRVGIGESHVRWRRSDPLRSLFRKKHALLQAVHGASVPSVAPAKIFLIRLEVFRGTLSKSLPLLSTQLQLETLRDLARDLVLDGENIDELAIVIGAP